MRREHFASRTLTEGKPKLVSITNEGGIDEKTLLQLVASLERSSEHPLAAAIVKGAEERGVQLVAAEGFESITGEGVKGCVDGRDVAVGNHALIARVTGDAAGVEARAKRGSSTRRQHLDGFRASAHTGKSRPSLEPDSEAPEIDESPARDPGAPASVSISGLQPSAATSTLG